MHRRSRCSQFFPPNEWIYPSKRLISEYISRTNFVVGIFMNSSTLSDYYWKAVIITNILLLQASNCKFWQMPYFMRLNTPSFDKWLTSHGFDTSNFNKCPTSYRLQPAGFDKCLTSHRFDTPNFVECTLYMFQGTGFDKYLTSHRFDTSDFDKCPISYGFDTSNFDKYPTSNRLQAASFDKYPTSYRL